MLNYLYGCGGFPPSYKGKCSQHKVNFNVQFSNLRSIKNYFIKIGKCIIDLFLKHEKHLFRAFSFSFNYQTGLY